MSPIIRTIRVVDPDGLTLRALEGFVEDAKRQGAPPTTRIKAVIKVFGSWITDLRVDFEEVGPDATRADS